MGFKCFDWLLLRFSRALVHRDSLKALRWLEEPSSLDNGFCCSGFWTLVSQIHLFLHFCGKHIYINSISCLSIRSLSKFVILFQTFSVSADVIAESFLLQNILVSSIGQLWKSVIHDILLSITVFLSHCFILIYGLLIDLIGPGLVSHAVLPMSVAVMTDIVVN